MELLLAAVIGGTVGILFGVAILMLVDFLLGKLRK